jgi:hypothetical protein
MHYVPLPSLLLLNQELELLLLLLEWPCIWHFMVGSW